MSFPKYRAAGIIDGADWDDFVLNMVAHSLRHVLAGADPIITPLDAGALALTTHGDIVFSGAGNLLTRLGTGNAGDLLQSGGAGADLSWVAAGLPGAHEATHVLGGADDIDAALDARAIALAAQGEIVYHAAAANTLVALAVGVAGEALLSGGPAANVSWGAPAPAAHAASHMDGGADELDVSDLAGAVGGAGEVPETDGAAVTWVDPDGRYVPLAHAASHADGAGDEIDAADLAGTGGAAGEIIESDGAALSYVEPDGRYTPAAHQASHNDGGADEIEIDTLAGANGAAGEIVESDGAAMSFVEPDGRYDPAAHAASHEPAGADEVNDIDIGNTGVLLSAHKARHVVAAADAFVGGDLLDATARVMTRRNTGANVGPRRRLNLIEGANVTLTVVDDGVNEEVVVTVAAAGAAATAWVDGFWPATDPNSNKGTYASVIMADETEITVRQTFIIPGDIVTVTTAAVIVIPDAGGDLYWSCATNFGQVCDNEGFQTNVDGIALNASTITQDEIECIDITAALTGATGGDLVGLQFVRDATNVLDTIGDAVHYIGVIIQGTV